MNAPVEANIAVGLRPLAVPIDSLHPHPDNPRRGNIEIVRESLRKFGQLKPVVARDTHTIVAGHHLWRSAKEEGWTEIAAVLVPMSDELALQYLLMDNRSSDLGTYDLESLATTLSDLQDKGLLEGTGYTPDDVDDIYAEIGGVEETAFEEFEGGYAEDPEVTAARYGRAHVVHREVVLSFPIDTYEKFVADVTTLRRAWGVDSARMAILEAVRRKAADPDEPFNEEGLREILQGMVNEGRVTLPEGVVDAQ